MSTPRAARIWVKRGSYRGRQGWHVYGTDWLDRRVRIFCTSEGTAESYRQALKTGDPVLLADAGRKLRGEDER